VKAGANVHIAARNRGRRPVTEVLPEGTVLRMQPLRSLPERWDAMLGFPAFFNPRWVSLIRRACRESKAGVIVVRDLPLALTALWVGSREGIPVVIDMAENYPAMIRLIWESGRAKALDFLVRSPYAVSAVERFALRHCDHVLVDTEEHADRLAHLGLPREAMTVVRNTPPRSAAEAPPVERNGRPSRSLRLVYLGLLEIPRGITELLEAVHLVVGRGSIEVELDIIGSGRDEAQFRAHAASLGLREPTVRFHGFLPRDRAGDLVRQADVGVNPIRSNPKHDTTVPNKLYDYMAYGLPVITSNSAPSARVVRETGAGEVYTSGNASELAEAIIRLADPDRRAESGRRGRKAILTEYHWERDTERLLAALTRPGRSA
jgi:glycosyltransferase involved in cell wall biosynthesis